ncbi:unnamed protein product [Rodentolepis nana]|uniref:Uncharacterized protein n=1 Tax=Rodentolepis nana TaxID=102285 RepID=A0A3P7W8P2_RODNA|nr:unnamed protein product [Rodentolepis nana]
MENNRNLRVFFNFSHCHSLVRFSQSTPFLRATPFL